MWCAAIYFASVNRKAGLYYIGRNHYVHYLRVSATPVFRDESYGKCVNDAGIVGMINGTGCSGDCICIIAKVPIVFSECIHPERIVNDGIAERGTADCC